jgi:mannose-6-phosphate isomerase-like protein (cupin superfamily)
MKIDKVNLNEKLSLFSKHWDPKIIGSLNGQHIKLVKFKGPFVSHHHETEDELFFVVHGQFTMHFRDRLVEIAEGEFIIVPHGVEHYPEAQEEVHVLLFEPASTTNTGSAGGAMTVEAPEWI